VQKKAEARPITSYKGAGFNSKLTKGNSGMTSNT